MIIKLTKSVKKKNQTKDVKKKFDTNLFKYDILYISISIIFYNKPTILRKSVMKENLV